MKSDAELLSAKSVVANGGQLMEMWRWVAIEPPLRDPRALSVAEFRVGCKICGVALGRAPDPVGALRVAWRNRRHRRDHAGLMPRTG
jgi:hypothetical protein